MRESLQTPTPVRPESVERPSTSCHLSKKRTGFRQAPPERLWGTTIVIIFLAFVFTASSLSAQSRLPEAQWANTQLPDARQEAQARELMESLRCLVCQGQSIADSDADMAADMRALVRRRIAAGEEPEAIRAWLIDRYGRWISFEPPIDAITWPLWLLPIGLIALGLWLARGRFKGRRR